MTGPASRRRSRRRADVPLAGRALVAWSSPASGAGGNGLAARPSASSARRAERSGGSAVGTEQIDEESDANGNPIDTAGDVSDAESPQHTFETPGIDEDRSLPHQTGGTGGPTSVDQP